MSAGHPNGSAMPGAPGRPLAVVTGAAGFIGSWLCHALLTAGWRVRGVDSLTRTYDVALKRSNVTALAEDPAFSFVHADLAFTDTDDLLRGADAVIHLAAEPGASSSWGANFSRYIERNVLVTQQLLNSAAALQIERFIYASSASVYGSSNAPLRESSVPHPINPYAASKLAGEHVVGVHASRGMQAVILRYFSIYGPRQRPDMAVHQFIEAALERRPLPLCGSGSQVRDMTYVGDAVAATVAALRAPLAPGTVLNIAGGHPMTMRQLAYEVASVAGYAPPKLIEESAHDGDVMRSVASIALARSALGWTPITPLSEGLSRQVEWQVERRRRQRRSAHANGSHPVLGSARGPRLMIYSQDGLGLGHLRRASSIASAFLEREPSGWVLTTSDSPLGTLLHDVHNHDYLKLPSIVKTGPGDWHPLSFPLDFAQLRQLRTRLILEAASAFEPDVLLVDHMPHGAMGELVPVLDALRGEATHIVLGLRDILDAPDVVRQRWADEGAFDALSRYYDEVLVYGSREVFDICERYGWPEDVARLVHYCGFVCTPQTPEDARRIRARRLGSAERGTMIAAMAGGGADAHELMSALLDALPLIHADQPCVLEIVTGPFMPDHQRRDLKRRAESLPVRLRRMVSDPLSRVAAADLVVAMAGYNTTMEVLRLGTPALLVPRRGPSAEQRMRAQRFAELGWVSQLDPDELSPRSLADAVLAALTRRDAASPSTHPDLAGLRRAADHLQNAAGAARQDASYELIGVATARRDSPEAASPPAARSDAPSTP